MLPNITSGISMRGGRVFCSHNKLAAKWESATNYHPNMCLNCDCGHGGWCDCGYLWDKDLVRALEEVPHGLGNELADYVKALPVGRQYYTPSNITAAIEDVDVTLIRCRDWTRDEQHHKAILRSSRPIQSLPSTLQGKRKHDEESSGSQSPRRSTKKAKIENEDTRRHSLLSVKNESDDDNVKGTSSKLKRPRQV